MGRARGTRRIAPLAVALAAQAYALDARAESPAVGACLSSSEAAQLAREQGRYRAARDGFAECARDACPAVVRRDCVRLLGELDALQPTLVLAAEDDRGADLRDVSVALDGEPLAASLDGRPLGVDAGAHVFTLSAGPRFAPARLSLVVRAGEKNRLVRVQLHDAVAAAPPSPAPAPPAASSSRALLPLVLGGAGVVALGIGAALDVSARSKLSTLESAACAPTRTCSPSDVQDVRTRLALGDVAAGVGIAALAAAAIVWLTGDHAPARAARVVDARPVAGGAVAGVRGAF